MMVTIQTAQGAMQVDQNSLREALAQQQPHRGASALRTAADAIQTGAALIRRARLKELSRDVRDARADIAASDGNLQAALAALKAKIPAGDTTSIDYLNYQALLATEDKSERIQDALAAEGAFDRAMAQTEDWNAASGAVRLADDLGAFGSPSFDPFAGGGMAPGFGTGLAVGAVAGVALDEALSDRDGRRYLPAGRYVPTTPGVPRATPRGYDPG